MNTVTLQYFKTIQNSGGEWTREPDREITLPCALTNYALKYGLDNGLLEQNFFDALIGVVKALSQCKFIVDENGELAEVDTIPAVAAGMSIDNMQMIKIIYLGCKGAQPDWDMTFDEFLKGFNQTLDQYVELYMSLVDEVSNSGENSFAEAFHTSTRKQKKA